MTDSKSNSTTKEQSVKKDSSIPQPKPNGSNKNQRWIILAVIGGMLALLGTGLLAAAIAKHYFAPKDDRSGASEVLMGRGEFGGFRGGYHSVEYTRYSSESDGLNTTTTSTTYVTTTGVVTSVSGSSLTVAGGGKSQTIKLDGDTQYASDKPSVNDTVRVTSNKDGDTLTAISVWVLNN